MVRICDVGGKGLLLPLLPEEQELDKVLRAFMYFVIMIWFFAGVGVASDVFMGAIEVIAGAKKKRRLPSGTIVEVNVWNSTIANLSLMALGSSAPEILLSVIEVVGSGMHAGPLGPSTIVGSAAFNLMCIIAVCVLAIPVGETRTIKSPGVFALTAFFSIFAYAWLVCILELSTPDLVEPWEGILTFCFFPIMVVLAYLVDIGEKKRNRERIPVEETRRALAHQGHDHSEEDITELVAFGGADEVRQDRILKTLSPDKISVGFMFTACSHDDQDPEVALVVEKIGKDAKKRRVGVEFTTRDGSMKSGSGHYQEKRDCVEIPAGEMSAKIVIKREALALFRSDAISGHRYFYVQLLKARELSEQLENDSSSLQEQIKSQHRPRVEIPGSLESVCVAFPDWEKSGLDPTRPGQLCFHEESVTHTPHCSVYNTLTLDLRRLAGCWGRLSCQISTRKVNGSSERNYVDFKRSLEFPDGVTQRKIRIPIRPRESDAPERHFFVVCSAVHDGVGAEDAPRRESTSCRVTLTGGSLQEHDPTDTMKGCLSDRQETEEDPASWLDQFKDALSPNPEAEEEATVMDWACHFVMLPWKIVFACIPPKHWSGGWLCFFCSLFGIGGVTAVIGDLAALLGCCLSIPDEITAITLVALGTSLPDTLSSWTAAVEQKTADDAIGNVTGSNAVNVFLGIGLPWMIASVYWSETGTTDEWMRRYPEQAARYGHAGFVVEAGDLVFSVAVFFACALAVLSVITFRRLKFHAELGGPTGAKLYTGIFFILLWVLYVSVVSAKLLHEKDSPEFVVIAISIAVVALIIAQFSISIPAHFYAKWIDQKAKEEASEVSTFGEEAEDVSELGEQELDASLRNVVDPKLGAERLLQKRSWPSFSSAGTVGSQSRTSPTTDEEYASFLKLWDGIQAIVEQVQALEQRHGKGKGRGARRHSYAMMQEEELAGSENSYRTNQGPGDADSLPFSEPAEELQDDDAMPLNPSKRSSTHEAEVSQLPRLLRRSTAKELAKVNRLIPAYLAETGSQDEESVPPPQPYGRSSDDSGKGSDDSLAIPRKARSSSRKAMKTQRSSSSVSSKRAGGLEGSLTEPGKTKGSLY
eukprot:TRINITY_DN27353_c0_g1_i1.p1 TRINITY_DN27353_c0_g1~~TRINITY_DN27353_c0_g1_i1.p1  ORF type:complete len:1119 (-),score=215.75 TRINITY_DN27353_c0_g1_i1:86-3376(-)